MWWWLQHGFKASPPWICIVLIPSWGTKHSKGCCAKVCPKHRSDGWGAGRASVKAMMPCCCEGSVPSWDLHTRGRLFQSETSQLLGSFFPCSGAHTALLQGLAPGSEMLKTFVFYFCRHSILWEKMLSQLIRAVSLEFRGLWGFMLHSCIPWIGHRFCFRQQEFFSRASQ